MANRDLISGVSCDAKNDGPNDASPRASVLDNTELQKGTSVELRGLRVKKHFSAKKTLFMKAELNLSDCAERCSAVNHWAYLGGSRPHG